MKSSGPWKLTAAFGSPPVDSVESAVFLTQTELATRWRISPRSLERWRWLKTGPNFTKIGGKVVYDLKDVEAYERRRRSEIKTPIIGNWR